MEIFPWSSTGFYRLHVRNANMKKRMLAGMYERNLFFYGTAENKMQYSTVNIMDHNFLQCRVNNIV